ncbi:nucleotidyltransferase domain-containing protein [Rickettsia oklahomensis]|uniref:Nucleotidyltransferase domain-containing protein n=1 Tax=Rickettsia oklahomensis TaxID=3141789 RepID=A0AAU7BZ71_9RICK
MKSLLFIKEVWLFCSCSRGDNKKRSDIDIAIICSNITNQE